MASVAAAVTRRRGLLLLGLAYLGFVSIGLPDGLLGVAWPSIRASFRLPIDALGALLVSFTAGYLASSFSSGLLLARVDLGALLALSCAATAASLVGYALAPVWPVVVALGAVAGLGAGAIDAGINTFAAVHYSPRTVSLLHAFYGVGATIGPLVMTAILTSGGGWRSGYAAVGGWQAALAVCFAVTRRAWPSSSDARPGGAEPHEARASLAATLRLPAAWAGIAIFFVYTGLEAAAGAWVFSLLTEARAVPAATAGLGVSLYYGGLTAGRLLSGVVAGAVPADRLLRACGAGMVTGAVLVWADLSTPANLAGLAVLGLSAAPVFPSLISATPGRVGAVHTPNAVGFQISAAVLGQSLVPAAIGIAADTVHLDVVAPALLAAAVVVIVLHEVLVRSASRAGRPQ